MQFAAGVAPAAIAGMREAVFAFVADLAGLPEALSM